MQPTNKFKEAKKIAQAEIDKASELAQLFDADIDVDEKEELKQKIPDIDQSSELAQIDPQIFQYKLLLCVVELSKLSKNIGAHVKLWLMRSSVLAAGAAVLGGVVQTLSTWTSFQASGV